MNPSIGCILCGQDLSSTIEDPRGDDRHVAMVCGAHGDDELSAMELYELWTGLPPDTSQPFAGDNNSKVLGVWAQADGELGVYLLLSNEELWLMMPQSGSVGMACVPRSKRLLEQPRGVPVHTRWPWDRAVEAGWAISSIRGRPDGRVDVCFPGRGTVTFYSYMASWLELGNGRYFLGEDWSPGTGTTTPSTLP